LKSVWFKLTGTIGVVESAVNGNDKSVNCNRAGKTRFYGNFVDFLRY